MIEATFEDIAVAGEGNQFLMLLRTQNDDVLPIVIGHLEAMSIVAGRSKEELLRPMSHDLMLSMLDMLNATVKRIEITDLSEGTFYARLIIENRGVEFELDARPSDSLALAVRTDAPLFIAESVIEQAAMSDMTGSGGAEA